MPRSKTTIVPHATDGSSFEKLTSTPPTYFNTCLSSPSSILPLTVAVDVGLGSFHVKSSSVTNLLLRESWTLKGGPKLLYSNQIRKQKINWRKMMTYWIQFSINWWDSADEISGDALFSIENIKLKEQRVAVMDLLPFCCPDFWEEKRRNFQNGVVSFCVLCSNLLDRRLCRFCLWMGSQTTAF